MRDTTRKLWDKQNQYPGDRLRLFRAVREFTSPTTALYAGSYVDIAPSFVFPNVTYVDVDRRAKTFFDDEDGVREIIADEAGGRVSAAFSFMHSDYSKLDVAPETFDLLISLYAGFISEHCTGFLKIGGCLLVNPSHGDVALASLDPRYRLAAVVLSAAGDYRVSKADLCTYMQPKNAVELTRESLFASNRGIDYTRPAFAYLFERIA